jgi:hypothetical protein
MNIKTYVTDKKKSNKNSNTKLENIYRAQKNKSLKRSILSFSLLVSNKHVSVQIKEVVD